MTAPVRGALDESTCRQIHEAALRLLREVGCDVLDGEALALLAAHGASVDGARARFGEELVDCLLYTSDAADE